MKRIIKVLGILIVILCLSACKKEKLTDINGIEKSNFDLGEAAVYKGIEYSVVEYYTEEGMAEENKDELRLVVMYNVRNTNSETAEFHTVSELVYENGEEIDNYETSGVHENKLEPNKTYSVINKYDIKNAESKFEFLLVIDEPEGDSIQMRVKLNQE